MRMKSKSSVGLESTAISRIRSRNLHPLISPPNFDDNNFVLNVSLFPTTTKSNISLQSKEIFKFNGHQSKHSLTLKKTDEINPIKERTELKINKLDNIESCRKTFEKIIEKDRKYGSMLKCIKDIYEMHLEPQYKQNNDINIKTKITKNNHDDGKINILKKTIAKSRSNSFFIKTKKNKLPNRKVQQKDSSSTVDTIVTSPRSNVPELSLFSVPKADFHQEFMSNFDNFSESWRKLARDINK